ncbi:hypothetical protein F2Q70_00029403 [Brassica cretica]|uniref:Uncharacterized protein n=1 Tax=Brassica cretica TaxID=69181 RepID=A0A8S9FIN4_BRACR|nr:hypothetical protein F2Q70_00029403 [Brassica cretica]
MEPIEEIMYMSNVSHLVVPKYQRPPVWIEEAAEFHKRVKRIHDLMKIVVPCAVFKAESSIPPDRSMQFSSYIEVLDDHQHVEASQKGLRFRDEVDKGPAEATSIDTGRIPSNDTNKPASINTISSTSIDTGRISEQKEFDVCENLRDGDTTTRSDKSGGKKRRNWKKRKRIMGDSQLSLIPHFSDGFRKSKERSICFSKPFAKEPKLTSNTKPDTTACLGAWYTWDRILQTSLEGLLDVDCNIAEVRFKAVEGIHYGRAVQRRSIQRQDLHEHHRHQHVSRRCYLLTAHRFSYASVAVVGCGSIDRVSDLEMEVHCVSLVLVVFLSGGIVSIGCMSSVSSLVSVPQEISKVCGLSSGSPCRVMKSPVLGLTIGGRGSNDKCGLGAEVEVGWRAMGSSGNSRSLAFLSFKVYQVFCSSPK